MARRRERCRASGDVQRDPQHQRKRRHRRRQSRYPRRRSVDLSQKLLGVHSALNVDLEPTVWAVAVHRSGRRPKREFSGVCRRHVSGPP